MARGGFHRKANMSSKRAESALIMLLTGCKAEKLASFTAAGLHAAYNVPVAKCETLLSQARQGWLV